MLYKAHPLCKNHTVYCIHVSKRWNSARREQCHQNHATRERRPRPSQRPQEGEDKEAAQYQRLLMAESSRTWFSVTRGTVIRLNHFSGHFVRRISSIIPLIAMSNAIASWVLSQTKVSASGQKVTFCLHDYFLKHLSSPRCESWLFCL